MQGNHATVLIAKLQKIGILMMFATDSVYHDGERAIQALAGRQAEAQALGGMIAPRLSFPSAKFLSSQSFAIASSVDSANRVWASLLTGPPGFLEVLSAQSLYIHCDVPPHLPLSESIKATASPIASLGLVVIDLATRARLRLNGTVTERSASGISLELRQVYFNCPMYIQRRALKSLDSSLGGNSSPAEPSVAATRSTQLSYHQSQLISQADTFFIASLNSASSDADASHRGGFPGFVKVISSNAIAFPDYSGNNMFNTLGNIYVNPQVGLIFINFEESSTLQITGRAKILWDTEIVSSFLGAERVILLRIDQVLESSENGSMQWEFVDYSPYNPSSPAAKLSHESEQFVPPLSEEVIEKMLRSFSP
jgi:uncharacterized protein